MGILDEMEKIDEEDGVRGTLKRIEKLQEENNRILREIHKMLKAKKKGGSKK